MRMHGGGLQPPRTGEGGPTRRGRRGLSSTHERPSWEEIDPPSRPPEIARLVQEFLRDYPPGDGKPSSDVPRKKAGLPGVCATTASTPNGSRMGHWFLWRDPLRPNKRKGRRASFLDSFKHAGTRYLVDDLYCPNPECHCDAVHLAFVRQVPSGEPGAASLPRSHFLAKLSFDGRAEIEERHFGTPSEAKAVLSTWQEQYGDDLEELRWRYEKVKEIARRSIPRRTVVCAPTNPLPTKNPRQRRPHRTE